MQFLSVLLTDLNQPNPCLARSENQPPLHWQSRQHFWPFQSVYAGLKKVDLPRSSIFAATYIMIQSPVKKTVTPCLALITTWLAVAIAACHFLLFVRICLYLAAHQCLNAALPLRLTVRVTDYVDLATAHVLALRWINHHASAAAFLSLLNKFVDHLKIDFLPRYILKRCNQSIDQYRF